MSGIITPLNPSSGAVDLTAPSTPIGSVTPVAVTSTIFTASPANNTSAYLASGSSLTGSNAQSLLNLSQTWNTTGSPSAINVAITNTASGASSNFVRFLVGGSERFSLGKDAVLYLQNSSSSQFQIFPFTAGLILRKTILTGGWCFRTDGGFVNSFQTSSDGALAFSQSIFPDDIPDTLLYRGAAGTFWQRNAANSQTYWLSKSFTDTSNYTRSAWKFDANGVAIEGESAGTGDANISISLLAKGTGSIRANRKIYPATDANAAQTATGIYGGTGAPSNANGADGDFYLRSDGGALTTIYQRRAGTWTGIV